MSRGKVGTSKNKTGSMKLPESVWDELEQIGGGNKTEGVKIIYEYYMERAAAAQKDEQSVVETVHKHIHAPDSPALRENYLTFVDAWFGSDKTWNAPMIYTLMGITKKNNGSVKRALKLLVNNKFIEYSIKGFKPVIRCNGGWTQEEFDIHLKEYIRILQS